MEDNLRSYLYKKWLSFWRASGDAKVQWKRTWMSTLALEASEGSAIKRKCQKCLKLWAFCNVKTIKLLVLGSALSCVCYMSLLSTIRLFRQMLISSHWPALRTCRILNSKSNVHCRHPEKGRHSIFRYFSDLVLKFKVMSYKVWLWHRWPPQAPLTSQRELWGNMVVAIQMQRTRPATPTGKLQAWIFLACVLAPMCYHVNKQHL